MSKQSIPGHGSDVMHTEVTTPGRVNLQVPHDSDDEPMVYVTPHDYKTEACQERNRLLAEGADPDSVILQSEIHNKVPRRDAEPIDGYTKRYVETMTSMISRGVIILNDVVVADAVPSEFGTAGGRYFDLGPASGASKREYREFREWWETSGARQTQGVPDKWLKFEKPRPQSHG